MALRRHAALLFLLAIAAPLMFIFAEQDRLASFGDDSVSYLTLARWFQGPAADPFVTAWAGYHSHFPPLFPLLLRLTGGAHSYRAGYALVAACAVIALPIVYRYASTQLASAREGFAVTALFLLMPTAWISLKGILSESLYLLTCMACLLFFESRLAGPRQAPAREHWMFGGLLALACLSRALGIALLLAYAAHLLVRRIGRKDPIGGAPLVAFVPPILLLAAWYALRPHAGADGYHRAAAQILADWGADPVRMLERASAYFASGWIASFTTQADVAHGTQAGVLALGAIAIAGVVLRVARNRLDGWFLLVSLGTILPWVFSPENTRRLLYPLLPLLLVCGASFAGWAAARARLGEKPRALLLAALAALCLLASAPAMVLLWHKAHDYEAVIPGYDYTYRDVAEFYTTIDADVARDRAKLAVVTLAGLEAIDQVTPKAARVMWMRPEYVALLGRRPATAFLYGWSAADLARAVKGTGTGYVVRTWLYKTDLAGARGSPRVDVSAYASPAFEIGDIFVLLRVDPAKLDAFLAGSSGG